MLLCCQNSYFHFRGSHSKTTEKDTNLNEAAIEPEDIVNSVVGDDKTSDRGNRLIHVFSRWKKSYNLILITILSSLIFNSIAVAVLSTIETKGCKLFKVSFVEMIVFV